MGIKPVRTKAHYRAALKSLMVVKANTPEGHRLDVFDEIG